MLLAAGAAALLLGAGYGELVDLVLFSCGLVGVARATVPKLAVPLIGALLFALFLFHFWALVPAQIAPEYAFQDEHPFLIRLPERLGAVVATLLWLATVVLAARRVGGALAGIAIAAWLISLIAFVVGWFALPVEPGAPVEGFATLVEGTTSGMYPVARALTAAIWLVLAVPGSVAKSAHPAPTVFGAIGATLVAASLWGVPTSASYDLDVAEIVYLLVPTAGWIFTLVGLVGLRTDHGKVVFAGVALIALQVLCCPVTGWGFESLLAERFFVIVYVPAVLGLLGVAVAAVAKRDAPMKPLRWLASGLAALAALAVVLAVFLYFAAEVTDMRIDDPFRPIRSVAQGAAAHGMLGWAIYCALRAFPPREPATD